MHPKMKEWIEARPEIERLRKLEVGRPTPGSIPSASSSGKPMPNSQAATPAYGPFRSAFSGPALSAIGASHDRR